MLPCFTEKNQNDTILITALDADQLLQYLSKQNQYIQNWVNSSGFQASSGQHCPLADATGKITQVLVGLGNDADLWSYASFITKLPPGQYAYSDELGFEQMEQALLAWGLAHYEFCRYKKDIAEKAQLYWPSKQDFSTVEHQLNAIYHVRDLINTPMEDMGPDELFEETLAMAKRFNANVSSIVGDELLRENYPAIHTVGRASVRQPRLIDLTWGDKKHPKVTLVGKGVCFDSGGLNIKTGNGMGLMKKDMGGAAHALGLAQLIMAEKLPVCLRVLIPAVENAISSNAYRPGDVITMRSGLTVEVTNTDAEGRLVLADALTEACSESPELLIDFATLTGAARVAVGTEIAAMFSNCDETVANVLTSATATQDAVWPLPLYAGYREKLNSKIADMVNSAASGYAGASTAALFLQAFVKSSVPWLHFDMMAWNISSKPGRPEGGDAMGIRALLHYLRQRFQQ